MTETGRGGHETTNADPPMVSLVLKAIPHYRRRFLELLLDRLRSEGLRLQVIYGEVIGRDAEKQHTVALSWGEKIRNRMLRLGGKELYWQPCLSKVKDSDLVIVIQESKLLVNYVLWLWYRVGGPKLALWGHGRDFQASRWAGPGEWLKSQLSSRVHWWFAYTERSRQAVRSMGYPDRKITVVNNALDTRELLEAQRQAKAADLDRLRRSLDLRGTKTCIFAGSLTRERNMPYLIEAARWAREKLPDFELMILGMGPEEAAVKQLVSTLPWIKLVGPRFGAERVPYFMLAKLLLIPGMVGLHVLDSFAMQVPLVTLDLASHSPEIVYVRDGQNGRVLPRDTTPEGFADSIVSLLREEGELRRLKAGCRSSADMYSVEDMCNRFAAGILRALEER